MPDPDGFHCTPMEVDGTQVMVRGAADFTDTDREMFAEVVRATKAHVRANPISAAHIDDLAQHLDNPEMPARTARLLAKQILGELQLERERRTAPDGYILGYRDVSGAIVILWDGNLYEDGDAIDKELAIARSEDPRTEHVVLEVREVTGG